MHKEPLYDDATLIGQLARRNKEAFELVYNKYFASLFYFAKRYVTDEQAAEDITTESFMKLWDKAGDFANMKKLQNFLFLATRNSCINFLRGEKRKLHREKAFTSMSAADTTADQEQLTVLLYQYISDEVAKMPKQLKLIFKLSYIDGLSNEEIVEKLGLSYSTVKNHKTRLLNILREKFAGRDLFTLIAFWQALELFRA